MVSSTVNVPKEADLAAAGDIAPVLLGLHLRLGGEHLPNRC